MAYELLALEFGPVLGSLVSFGSVLGSLLLFDSVQGSLLSFGSALGSLLSFCSALGSLLLFGLALGSLLSVFGSLLSSWQPLAKAQEHGLEGCPRHKYGLVRDNSYSCHVSGLLIFP